MSSIVNSSKLAVLDVLFSRLSRREQLLIMLMFCVGVIAGLYWGVWAPIQREQQAAQKAYHTSISNYYRLIENAEFLSQLSPQKATTSLDRSANELRAIINETARKHQIIAERINLDGTSRLQVWVNDMPFASVSAWLNELGKVPVGIHSMQITSQTAGQVSLRITFD